MTEHSPASPVWDNTDLSARGLHRSLRNKLRKFPLLESLAVIQAYLLFLQHNVPLPSYIKADPVFLRSRGSNKIIFEWELELLAKELVLNAPTKGTRSLTDWPELAGLVNKLRQLGEDIGRHPRHREIFARNALLGFYRTLHRQVPWQQPPDKTTIVRYHKIFGQPALDKILRARLGLSAAELYTLGFLLTGFFLDTFALNWPVNLEVPGLNYEALTRFLRHFAIDVTSLKQQMTESRSYDQDYEYAFNPLKMFPLVWVEFNGGKSLIAPVPTYLIRRFTEGVYYEIYEDQDFAKAFGSAFQHYVGEVLNACNKEVSLNILPENEYYVGKERKDSVDWIASDKTAHFIECKTKKIRYASKIALANTEVLDEDLEKMATFIVQTYKALRDAQHYRYKHWVPGGRPIYPLIVTLEDWYICLPNIVRVLDEHVRKRLLDLEIDLALLEQAPYTVCSVADFERIVQVITQIGVQRFMSKRFEDGQRFWPIRSFMLSAFKEEMRSARASLFPDVMDHIGTLGEAAVAPTLPLV
jgi:hypothetical protein